MTTKPAEAETLDDAPAPDAPEADAPAEETPEQSFAERLEQRIEAAMGEGQAEEEDPDAEAEPEEGGEAAPEAGEAGEGEAEGAEAAAEEEDAPEGADAGDSLVLRLPGRHADDEDIEIPLTAEQLEAAGIDARAFTERQNQLRNGYMRGNEVRAAKEEVRAEKDELDFIYNALQERPAEFLASTVSPSLYPELVRTMLLKLPEETYDSLLTEIAQLDKDDATRQAARLELKEKELEQKDQGRKRAASSDYVKDIRKQIISLVPEEMDDARAEEFFDFALHKLERWTRTNRGQRIDTARIPALLKELGALDPYGISPNGEADARTDAPPTPENARRQPRPADPELAERAKRTGKDLTERAKSRRKAAATAPAGAGAAANPGLKASLKGLSFEEKMKKLAASPLKLGSS